jgi:protoporphyrinogen/coproporphyrinogen III oxidase
MTPFNLIVIGGGISGLLAAHHAANQSQHVLLLEQTNTLGGMVQTCQVNGFTLEAGPHTFPATATTLLQVCQQIGLNPVPVEPTAKKRYLVHKGRLCAAPADPFAAICTPLLSVGGKLALLTEPFKPRLLHQATSDVDVQTFVTHRFGAEVANNLVAPLLTGIYAGNTHQLGVRAVFGPLAQWEQQHGSVLAGAWHALRNRPKAVGQTSKPGKAKGRILGFPGGMGTLTQALAQALPQYAVTVQLNTPVVAMAPHPAINGQTGWQITTAGGQTHTAPHIAFATPAYQTAPLLGPWCAKAEQALSAITYSPVTVLHFGFKQEDVGHPLDGFGFLVPPSAALPILGCIFASSLFACRAPNGHVLLTVMIGGAHRPELTELPQADLLPKVLHALTPLLGITGAPVLTERVDWPMAIPQLGVGHSQQWATVQQALPAGVKVLGNFGAGVALNHVAQAAKTVGYDV